MGTPLHRLVRGRGLRWVTALGLAIVAGSLAAATVQRAEATRATYGESRRVPVAAVDLSVGTELSATDVTWDDWPAGLVPDGVAEAPVGRIVTEPVTRGEILVDRRLARQGVEGAAALVGGGRRALAVPIDSAPPGVGVGDHVEVFTPATTGATSDLTALADLARAGGSGARKVARDALVVALDERSVRVSVTGAEAPALAAAILDGALTIALVAPG